MTNAWFEEPEAHGPSEEHLRAERVAGQRVVEVTVLGADARGVREDAEIARRFESTIDAHGAVTRVVVALAGRHVHARSEGEGERFAVRADEAQVGAEAEVADGGRRSAARTSRRR